MNKNKGFTLIELIAVITLIAVLSLLVVPTIIGLVNENKPKISSATKELIYSATGAYLDANQTEYKKISGAVYCPTINNLIDSGFLNENLTDIEDGTNYGSDEKKNLVIKSEYNGYKYKYSIVQSADCVVKEPEIQNAWIGISKLEYPTTNAACISTNNLISGSAYSIKVYVETKNIPDNTNLTLNVRKGSKLKTDSLTITGGTVNNDKTEFTILIPGSSSKSGEYVVEVTGGNAPKAVKTFTIELVYTDPILSGSDPNLLNCSLTPVVYDETKKAWVVADPTTEWYNYANQKWANAVILKSGVTKSVGDTISLETDGNSIPNEVKAMYVWIPRYEYKIEGTYGTHLDGTAGTQSTPGAIDVKFISKDQKTADTNYILHPAFTWDDNSDGTIASDEHISGIWVGKFNPNASVTDSGCTGEECASNILPNSSAVVQLNINRQFAWAKRYESILKDASSVDAHMMKNSEWGAVAYLSQSKYGKYGNSLYTGTNKRIYKNNSSKYVTGASSGKIPASGYTTSGTCKYDDITDRGNGTGSCGGGASTTGNITGIYDMVGPVYINVSARWASGDSFYGFTRDKKYYDVYSSNDSTTACNGGICYGHALSETVNFYTTGTTSGFLTTSRPWVQRSWRYNSGSVMRIFSHGTATGDENEYISFKSVILMSGA